MGLDMYLYTKPKGSGTADVYRKGPFTSFDDMYLDGVKEVGYWRKVNAVHRWFVEHSPSKTDDCQPYVVHPEALADLYLKAKEVLTDREKAPDLLPTQPGFFFGDTDYDQYYFSELEETLEILDKVKQIIMTQPVDLIYEASW